ncbi:MAG: LutB/LldF family L-lactate oxidation iron-sulfur protein [Deltaproteobacteria bacterium]
MTSTTGSIPFRDNAAQASHDATLRAARHNAMDEFTRMNQFAASATRAGAIVHRARDGAAAREIVGSILKDRGVSKVVKAKSMISEEIGLNTYLEEQQVEVVETDLGEYIVQLAGERPSHILAPAIHKSRQQIGKLFAEKLDSPYYDDPRILTSIARKALREKFLSAEAGITGANFAAADTGSLAIFTNEGNGRMVTTLPPLHIAVLSIEKVIPSLGDLATFIRLLPRSATGQVLSAYLSVVTGTRKEGEATGARELHIVLLDNGRWEILDGDYWEILKCIRCSACINACPVYRTVGGHAYNTTYSGPMGIVLSALLDGMERSHPLLDATTLCGACDEVCPVKVPLTKLFYALRERKVEEGFASSLERKGMEAFGVAAKFPPLFYTGQSLARRFWSMVGKIGSGVVGERLPRPAEKTFRKRMSGK